MFEATGGVGLVIIGLVAAAMLPALYRKLMIEAESHRMWMKLKQRELDREERGFD